MSGVCYFILIKKPINFKFLKDFIILNYGDILLLKHSERDCLQSHSDKYVEFELNDDTVKNYLSSYNHREKSIIYKPPHILRKTFAYPDLLISMIDNINIKNHIHPDFKKSISFSLLSIFSDAENLIAFLTSGMPTFSGKVRSILLSDVSKHWKLRDLADYLYMSESLIKKKLLLENTSFSKLLLDTRMSFAIKLLKQNHSIKYVSEMCGFSSTSYFVYIFRQYYECTPRKYIKP
ncbi:helix-turn-helix domain-containing protein [Escherichia coli]|nr:helix-turn-helix domain-containing protein [Shigella flexneri]EIX7352365.1 helix-turn-helix domain-containing protein [Escherichia coli]